jgi:hypothetical protein
MKEATLSGVVVGLAILGSGGAMADYHICKSTYALCTTAKCAPATAGSDTVACSCEVRTGYSVGSAPCEAVKQTRAGSQVVARYFPIKSYARCTNNRPWADCYDKTCVVDAEDPSKATCTCSVKESEGDYVRVTSSYSAEMCTIGLWSSATVSDLEKVTSFLKSRTSLPLFPLNVVNADTLGTMTPSSGKMPARR